MFGKGALIVTAGFSMIVGGYSLKMNRLAVDNSQNFNAAWYASQVHEAAMSGMNYGANQVWLSNSTVSVSINTPPCTTSVSVWDAGGDSIVVKAIARTRYFDDAYWVTNRTAKPLVDSVFAYFSLNTPVSRWACYTNQDNGIDWTSGDTVWGPLHCNHNLRTHGSPVFYGKVTAKLGVSPNPNGNSNHSDFIGGWEIGIDAPLPSILNYIRTAAFAANGDAPMNTKSVYNNDLSLTFFADGRVRRIVGALPADTVQLSTIAPTGVIYSSHDIKVSGTFHGVVTIYTEDDIWVENDLTYSANPLTDPNCSDILGLVSAQNVIVTDNAANNSDVNLDGCIYAANGSFIAQNYATRPRAGNLRIRGSVAQAGKGHVATVSAWDNSVTHGFNKSYYYDPRLRTLAPPYFPSVKKPRLISWWE